MMSGPPASSMSNRLRVGIGADWRRRGEDMRNVFSMRAASQSTAQGD